MQSPIIPAKNKQGFNGHWTHISNSHGEINHDLKPSLGVIQWLIYPGWKRWGSINQSWTTPTGSYLSAHPANTKEQCYDPYTQKIKCGPYTRERYLPQFLLSWTNKKQPRRDRDAKDTIDGFFSKFQRKTASKTWEGVRPGASESLVSLEYKGPNPPMPPLQDNTALLTVV